MRSRGVLVLAIIALVGANAYVYFNLFAPHTVQVEALRAGKGNALLVKVPGGRAVLVGAGPDASILRALGEALPPWQRHLDVLILLTSALAEAGGAPFVLERYRVSHLLRSEKQGAPTREAALAVAASAEKGLEITQIPGGTRVTLHLYALSLELSASTTPGTYALK